jgi:hypothetical protein
MNRNARLKLTFGRALLKDVGIMLVTEGRVRIRALGSNVSVAVNKRCSLEPMTLSSVVCTSLRPVSSPKSPFPWNIDSHKSHNPNKRDREHVHVHTDVILLPHGWMAVSTVL